MTFSTSTHTLVTSERLLDPDATVDVATGIIDERAAQDARWGQQNHRNGTGSRSDERYADAAKALCDLSAKHGTVSWKMILDEEVREAFAESDPAKLRAELIQVAAVASAWVEAIDRSEAAVNPISVMEPTA